MEKKPHLKVTSLLLYCLENYATECRMEKEVNSYTKINKTPQTDFKKHCSIRQLP